MRTPDRHSIVGLARQLRLDKDLLLVLAGESTSHYRAFVLHRPGKKPREIDNPDEALKLVQRRIRRTFLAPLPLPEHVHGCVRGCSPLSNAKRHLGKPNVASVDVKNFYPSVTNTSVFRVWRRLGYGPRAAGVLTKLTTRGGHLPQGAPTSDALANHFMSPVDVEIADIARLLGLHLSRYLDNIDLSGDRASEAIPVVIAALRREGLSVRHKKVFNVGRESRQVVTGYTVNNGSAPSIGRSEQRRVRSAVHELICLRRAGMATVKLERRLRGRLEHLRRTNAGAAVRLDHQLAAAGITLR
jgi:hypothetical protein